ncbi:helix-turn-helix domain-containing protein [Nonomuraea rubra]|uniref:helix-turn-helix domain-containing protein n=1 Tax=Nonomuraea rubra TaxID=46180 RepID=UPI0036144FD1
MQLREFGEFLRSRRDRIRPGEVGVPVGARRRVPGLRRDEVAGLAGLSVDYYNQLEQGRGAQPSEQLVAALARALRLTEDERSHLYFLAGRPSRPGTASPRTCTPACSTSWSGCPRPPPR